MSGGIYSFCKVSASYSFDLLPQEEILRKDKLGGREMEMSDLGETRPGAVTTNGGRRAGDHKSEQLREPDGAGWCAWSCKTVLDRPRWWRRVCNCSRKGGFSLGNWCQQWIPVSVSRQEKLWDRDVGFLTQSGHHRDEQYFLADLCGCQCHRDTLRLWWIALRIFEPKEQHQWRVSTEKICTADFAG